MSEESKSWYRMTRPLFNSGFEDDEFWAYGKDGFQEVLDSFEGADVLIYDKTIKSEPQRVRAIIQQKMSDVYNSTTVRQILCNIGTLRCGQYVEHEGAMWIVSALPDNNRIYEKAVLWKCKHNIRFVSPLTREIVEYPVFSTNSTQYGTGEAGKPQMAVGEDQHLVYIPYNKETIAIDSQFRLLMDKNHVNPTAYRITRVDPVSYAVGDDKMSDGLIQWAILEDQYNPATDNAELMVADYYAPSHGGVEITPDQDASITLVDMDGDFKVACGEEKQIRVKMTDSGGGEIASPEYRLECKLGGAATVSDDSNGMLTLRASEDISFVGKSVEIKVINDRFKVEAVMTIQIVNW